MDLGLEYPTIVIESSIKFVQTNDKKKNTERNLKMDPEMPFKCDYQMNSMFQRSNVLVSSLCAVFRRWTSR